MRFAALYSHQFGKRMVANLLNEPGHCRACGPVCDGCKYDMYSLVDSLVAVEELPKPEELPPFVDEPEDHLPELPPVDVLVAIGLHPDLLVALSEVYEIKALIVPVEEPDWIDPWIEEKLREVCEENSVELTVARPGCDLEPSGPVTEAFCDAGMIGRPKLFMKVEDGVVIDVHVVRSAPCGCTWFVAKRLVGVDADPEEVKATVSEAHHSYPCTASMEVDKHVGDTLLHVAGRLHIEAALRALEEATDTDA
ncbi:DUF166 domain-containing protein [Methanopyrus kandleri]|uniref:DUF166 domain-containing protein n=1 Tax=Methanopyrus kandleri TaxID=2320 RepID=A0A832T1U0_9EURY|nr:DUF166 domain-containing protein [Methanopyrus kandleri]HII70305.1 DUF166 domain-containing protein [Methanopyrus kandleri]